MTPGSEVHELMGRVEAMAPLVRAQARTAELESRPTDDLINALHDAGLFNMMLPRESGGAGLTVLDSSQVIEALARIDGSAGWTLGLGQGLIVGRLAPGAVRGLGGEGRLLIAGSLNPLQGRVQRREGGYHFQGVGTYVSNSTHATHMMLAGLLVDDEGRLSMTPAGPAILAGVLPRSQCEVLDTWAMVGMRGTGSHDVKFDGFVAEELTMPLGDALAALGGQLTPVSLGIAQHAIDAFVQLATTKMPLGSRTLLRDRVTAQDQLGRAAGLLQAGRSCFYDGLQSAAELDASGATRTNQDRAHLRLSAMMGAQLAADAVNMIFDASGMTERPRAAISSVAGGTSMLSASTSRLPRLDMKWLGA